MKKNLTLYIIFGFLLLLLVNIFALTINPNIYKDLLPGGSPSEDTTPSGISFPSNIAGNPSINTKDFKREPDVILIDEVTYQIDGQRIKEEMQYQIFYDDIDKSFTLSLQQEPLGEARIAAEEDLIERLGISRDRLCQMNIVVNTPMFVSEVYSGINLGISFCPGAVKL